MKYKKIITPVLLLLVCCLILLSVSGLAANSVAAAETAAMQEVMAQLLPGATEFTPEEYTGEDENITALYKAEGGYIVEATVRGYVDDITLLVGVRDDGRISGLTVREANETEGLGQRVLTDRDFLKQYLGSSGDTAVGENIDAITGATVTSKAVSKAVNSAAAFVTGVDGASSATEWSG